ncbi:MAG: Wzz/FepE/Etk N-terminal domain-containing protein [Deferrisomatales bacterium]|nr:Wzz/FepE/Etk N-terminal domain-containing protein [Deferrisomatales bacterium]
MPEHPNAPSGTGPGIPAEPGQAPPGGYPLYPPYWVPPPEDEISLLDLLAVLRRRWLLIAVVTLLGTGAAVAYALLATPIYRAQAVIAPPEQKKGGAASMALAAFGGLGAELAGSLGVNLGGTDANRLEALLKSRRLLERTVTKYGLLPVLFEKDWDAEKETWAVKNPKDAPTFWDAEKKLEKIYSVRNDAKAGVLRVSFDWKETARARQVLEAFLTELALSMQEDELRKIEANRTFAETQLAQATDPVIVAKLQGLLSEQVEKAMMAQNVEHFAFELIDPAAVSDRKVKPKRALVAAVGLTTSAFLGIFLSFLAEWLHRVSAASTARGR